MTGFQAVIDTRNLAIATDITGKDTVNSIDPADVGNNLSANIEALLPFMDAINAFTIYTGTTTPLDALGVEGDEYWQTNGGVSFVVWRKTTTTWALQATIPLGISYQDGIITGLRTQISLADEAVSVTSGSWAISNTIYSKGTPTYLNYDSPVVGSDRIDTIYADTSGQILYLAGAPSGSPVKPTLPSNTIEVDSIYVPADGTRNAYLFSAGSETSPQEIEYIEFDQSDFLADTNGNLYIEWDSDKKPLYVEYKGNEASGVGLETGFTPQRLYGFPDTSTATIKVKIG